VQSDLAHNPTRLTSNSEPVHVIQKVYGSEDRHREILVKRLRLHYAKVDHQIREKQILSSRADSNITLSAVK